MISGPSESHNKNSPNECHYDGIYRNPVSAHRLTINRFSTYLDKPVGEEIRSPVFSFDTTKFEMAEFKTDVKWQIAIYPNGHDSDHEGNVTFLLESVNDFDVKLGCQFTVSTNKTIYKTCKFRHTFRSNAAFLADCKITDRSGFLDLLEKGSDDLTVDWKIFFYYKPAVSSSHIEMLKNIGSLLDMEEHDVTLVSNDGIEHKAHKLMLICRSKIFSTMIRDSIAESQVGIVKIEDMDSLTLRHLLEFIYTGEIESVEGNAVNLFKAADKYGLEDLKEMCVKHLCKIINCDNVLELIDLAYTYNIWELSLESKMFFLKNSTEIVEIKGREYMNSLPRGLVDRLLNDLALIRDIGIHPRVRTLSDDLDLDKNLASECEEILKKLKNCTSE